MSENSEIDTEERRKLIELAYKEADTIFENDPIRKELGFCHLCWGTVQEILKSKYGIDWKTPAEETPYACFD